MGYARAMPPWSIAAVAAAGFFAVHYLTLRAASGRIGDAMGAFVLEGSAALGLLVLLMFRRAGELPASTHGVAWSCASGLCISGASTLLFAALRQGGPVASTGTIALGGGVAISALIAPFIFGEAFTARRICGAALGIAAMLVLAGEKS
jgi:drug/metabolite transporter (DMT)-like permease